MAAAAASAGDDRDALAAILAEIACAAGEVLAGFGHDTCGHSLKPDGSPTSAADLAAEEAIIAALAARFPGVPVIAEETASLAEPGARFFLVDPLDGTRDFLEGGREYCVCIALVEGERPIAAALAAPALGRWWSAGSRARQGVIAQGRPASPRPIEVRRMPSGGATVLVSSRHGDDATEACLAALPTAERRLASSAIKFGLVAAGEADLYVRCGPTMEWDTAAGDHILTVAGGAVTGIDGAPLTYGHRGRDYRNGAFAACGDPALGAMLRLAPA